MSKNQLIQLGILGRPFGVKGEITVHCFNTQSVTLKTGVTVTLQFKKDSEMARSITLTVKSFRWNKDVGLIKFQGIDSLDEIKSWVHAELLVARTELPELHPHEYYLCDLLGFEVYADDDEHTSGEKKYVGKVSGFSFNSAGQTIIHIQGPSGQILEILAYPFMKKVDLKESRCYIVLPDYEE